MLLQSLMADVEASVEHVAMDIVINLLRDLGDKPNQLKPFLFPKRKFGDQNLAIDPFNPHGLKSGHGFPMMKHTIKRFVLFVSRLYNSR